MTSADPIPVSTFSAWPLLAIRPGADHDDDDVTETVAVVVGSLEEAEQVCRAQNIRRLDEAIETGVLSVDILRLGNPDPAGDLVAVLAPSVTRSAVPHLNAGDRIRVVDFSLRMTRVATVVVADDGDLVVHLDDDLDGQAVERFYDIPGDVPFVAPERRQDRPGTVDTDRLQVTVRVSVDREAWETGRVGDDGNDIATLTATLVDEAIRRSANIAKADPRVVLSAVQEVTG